MDLPRPLQKYAHLIDQVSDERAGGDGYWVYLAPGWRSPDGETHCIHEDNPTQCAREMKYVVRCTAKGCCTE